MKLFLVLLFLLINPVLPPGEEAVAQNSLIASSADMLDPEVRYAQNTVPAGSEFRLAVLLNLEQNWHVNANLPTSDYLIGTVLSLDVPQGISVRRIQYPQEQEYTFAFTDEPVNVYEGEAPVFVTLATDETAEPGDYILSADLRVQACDNEVCLAPTNIPLEIPVEITAAGTGFQPLNQELFDNMPDISASFRDVLFASGGGEIAGLFNALGLFWTLAGVFLVGLALNLTPCVYPMLSVTVSLFGGRNESSGSLGHSFFMASVYVLGIVTMYSLLGVAAAYTGALFGSWLQSPWVLGAIGLLILVLALSMFGLYEIQAPASWMQKLSGTQRKTGGVIGHYFSGLIVGIFAAPCIGPPIIALLAFVGTQGDPLFGFTIFLVMALGLGVPYLVLGTFSGLLARLPKSGFWMVWVKKVFGVVLTGVALFYLSLAFFPGWSLHIVAAVLAAGGVYLAFSDQSAAGRKVFKRVRLGVGALTVIGGLLLFQNLFKEGIVWESYTDVQYEEALTAGTPVILDFYADWCIPCIELERSTYTDPDVIAASEAFVRLKVDLTQYESAESQALRDRFRIAGVPTVVFIERGGEEVQESRVVGYLPPETFLERVRLAGE